MLRKKLFLELIIGIIIICIFYVTQSLESKILLPSNTQIVSVGEENVSISNTDLVISKIVETLNQENYFEVNIRINPNSRTSKDIYILIDPINQDVNELKNSVIQLTKDIFEKTSLDYVRVTSISTNDVYTFSFDSETYTYDLAFDSLLSTSTSKSIETRLQELQDFFGYSSDVLIISNRENINYSNLDDSIHFYTDSKQMLSDLEDVKWQLKEILSDEVEFVSFSSSTTQDGRTIATYDESQHQIIGDLTYLDSFKISYIVRLKNEDIDFKSYNPYPISLKSELSFYDQSPQTYQLPEISVQGYQTSVIFENKSSITSQALENSVFQLSHDEDCLYCEHIEIPTFQAVSNVQGQVEFENVPSGHNYYLTQVSVNDNYELNKTINRVSILQGNVYIEGEKSDYVFDNIPKHNDTLYLTLACEVEELLNDYPYEVHYKIKGNGEIPLPEQTVVLKSEDGIIYFGPIHFTETGVYNYTISCNNKGLEANDIIVVVSVSSELLSGNQDLNATITYYNGKERHNNHIRVSNIKE